MPTASFSAGWSKASGRRRRAIDPWLSRPMRHELGLDLPERRIGLSAHDFAQLLGAEDVILSHAAKAGGAPAVASRFLHRLEAVAGDERWTAATGGRAKTFNMPKHSTGPTRSRRSRSPNQSRRARRGRRTVGDGDRGLAARSLHDLCQIHSEALTARYRRHAAVGGRPRLGDSRRARRIHKTHPANLPDDPAGVLRAIGESISRR